jgi:hypothetical protein
MFALQGGNDAEGLALDARDMDAPLADGDVAVGSCSGNLSLDAPLAAPKAGGQPLGDGIAPLAATAAAARRAPSFAPKVATRQAVIAVDTDNEFLQRKFNNNTSTATSYVAALFTALNAIYEDDPAQYGLQLRLVQGTVILRPTSMPDPFNNTDSNATGAALNEFGTYWQNNQSSVARAFALLLSGKSANQNGASGIAWVITSGNYCTRTASSGGHYSVNQVFWNPSLAASQDAYLVAHELGHNLGAFHTHCASGTTGAGPTASGTIDRCFSGESGSGCYAGPQSCPTGGESPVAPQGTLMSYCHLNGLNCGVSTELHPTHVSQLNGRLASQPTSCIGPLTTNQAPAITAPASFSAQEDVPLALSGLSFADPDAASTSLTATFSIPAGNGALNAAAASGVTIGGSATARTLSGTLSALNNALAAGGVTYVPAANASGNVPVTISLVDGGSPQGSDSETRNITIAAVNDAPTLSVPVVINGTEDQAMTIAPVSLADVDAGGASVVATFGVPSGTLAATGTALVTVGGTAIARTLTGSVANLNSFLAAGLLTYTAAANANGNTALTVQVNDQGNTGGGGARIANGAITLEIAPANDAPTVDAPASLQVTAGASVAVSPVSFADLDDPSGNITVVATFSAPSGTFSAPGGVAITGNGTSTLTLTATLSTLNTFLASTPVQYTAAAGVSGVVPLTLTINDQGNSGGAPLSASRTVNVQVLAPGTIFVNGFEP